METNFRPENLVHFFPLNFQDIVYCTYTLNGSELIAIDRRPSSVILQTIPKATLPYIYVGIHCYSKTKNVIFYYQKCAPRYQQTIQHTLTPFLKTYNNYIDNLHPAVTVVCFNIRVN